MYGWDQILLRCVSLNAKPLWRSSIDFVVLYIIPVLCSAFFYSNIIKVLRRREKQAGRNRNISVCFVASWLLWIIFWCPKFLIAMLDLPNKPLNYSLGKTMNKLMFYLYPSVFSLQILYSQLNPLLYLVLLKKFQTNVSTVIKLAVSKKKVRNGQPMKMSGGIHKTRAVGRVLTLATILLVTFSLAAVLFTSHSSVEKVQEFKSRSSAVFGQTRLSRVRLTQFNQQQTDLHEPKVVSAKRHLCNSNQGTFNFKFKRCYFVLQHRIPGLNFSEQVSKCEEHGAVLSYPRFYSEVLYLWQFFRQTQFDPEKGIDLKFFANTTLHVGYVRLKPVVDPHASFESVDNKRLVASNTHEELFQFDPVRSSPGVHKFKGPALCISRAKQLTECMPRNLKTFSICSIDFGSMSGQ